MTFMKGGVTHTEGAWTSEELLAALSELENHTPNLFLKIANTDVLRTLSLADPEMTVGEILIRISRYSRPLDDWTGTLGKVANLRTYRVIYPDERDGVAKAELKFISPTPLADIARAVYPLFAVDRGMHGYGFVQLGTAELPPNARGLLPTATAPGVPAVPTTHLQGFGLSQAEIGLVGTQSAFDSYTATADDPELTQIRQPLLVTATGHLAVSDREDLPLVDLNVHNPVGRVQTFKIPRGPVVLTNEEHDLTFHPYNREGEPLDAWTRHEGLPVSGQEVRRLCGFESIDLSRLTALGAEQESTLHRRLAELAATGIVLHSLPESFTLAEKILGEELAGLLRSPYTPSMGLARDLRSVPQRREAMRRFGGFLELAAHAQSLGHQLLPTVSVVLSTMRPSRVASVINALAAQTYPHLEIAVAIHGDDQPLGPDLEAAVRASGAVVMHHDRSVPFGTVLAETARRTSGDLVIKIDDDDIYGPKVIEDLVLAYIYSKADVVGKTTEYLYFEEIDHTVHRTFATETYHSQVAGGAMMLSRAALNEIGGWRPSHNSTDRSVLIRVGNAGGICYRTHSLGYVYIRHADGHTWDRKDSLLVKGSSEQWPRFVNEIVDV